MKYKIILVLATALLIFSCKKETETFVVDYAYEYFPNDSGHYVIYKVDSVTYNNFYNPVLVTQHSFYLKEVIESHFIDNLGRNADRIERYTKQNINDSWSLDRIWYQVLDETAAERVEENLRYIKLVFPPYLGQKWQGNKYIETPLPYIDSSFYSPWTYEIIETGGSFTNSLGTTFNDVVTVLQEDDSTAINYTYSLEKYAKNVGMVYKELWSVVAQSNPNITVPWIQRAQKGFYIKMEAIESGTE
ncbi:MAG: hypothetical protein H6553_03570 [Chitinophagales bacterium]|nr:hypothetical protein [Chitinophagales bacterium]